MEPIIDLLNSTGPAAACLIACMWYIVKKDERFASQLKDKDDQIERMRDAHKEESAAIVHAVNDLRVAVTELTAHMQKGETVEQQLSDR